MKNARLGSWLCLFVWLAACGDGSDSASRAPGGSVPAAPVTDTSRAEAGDHDLDAAPTPTSTPGASSGASSAPGAEPAAGTTPAGSPATPPASAAPSGTLPSAPTTPSTTPPPPTDVPGNGTVGPGMLTAGTWDDNRNFERFLDYRAEHEDLPGLLPTTDEEHKSAHDEFSEVHGARETLDVTLVIDTTGSMGDEIRYLQSEFKALSQAIETKYPNSSQRWSLVVYRDQDDEYVTRTFDFTENADDFRDKLSKQVAAGGGDFPEAPEAALAAMVQLGWRTDLNTARLVFWVADAPHHDKNAEAMAAAIRAARSIDVHVYPVASSGVDELTELTMRTAAQLSGGRYLFLTDDSGIGGAHKEPSIPCYFVTHLDVAILRMVDVELSGTYREPTQDEVIRRGGDPQNGTCKLESGEAQVF